MIPNPHPHRRALNAFKHIQCLAFITMTALPPAISNHANAAQASDATEINYTQSPTDKIDMMIILAHPDDEVVLGALIPHYARVEGRDILYVSITSGEWGIGMPHHSCHDQPPSYSYNKDDDHPRFHKVPEDALYPCYYRENELKAALATWGVARPPMFLRCKDMSGLQPWGSPDPAIELWGGAHPIANRIAEVIRDYQPDVVISNAANGMNGNPMHAAAAQATVEACKLAGIEGHSPNGLPHWAPKKVYLQVNDDETYPIVHRHEWDQKCPTTGESVRTIFDNGYALHESQEVPYTAAPFTDFTLIQSTVGADQQNRNDLFENIEPRKSSQMAGVSSQN